MGLSKPALRFLARTASRQAFHGEWLTLGRQCVYATHADFVRICQHEGVAPAELPADCAPRTNIPSWQGTARGDNTSDVAVLCALGARDVRAVDYSDFEGAELIHDLNLPAPAAWRGRFDGILDSGTLEHVFDVPAALANIVALLRVGGRVIHISPCHGFANHGFYQFSPTLLADYYQANNFANLRVYIAEEQGVDYESSYWDLVELDPQRQPVLFKSRRRLLLIVVADKTADATGDVRPMQSYYQQLFATLSDGQPGNPPSASLRDRVKRLLPVPVKTWLRRWLLGHPHGKPWGGRRLGRLR